MKVDPEAISPLNGTVVVQKLARADLPESGIIILDTADPKTTPFFCRIVATGPGRMSRENGRVPSVTERGWVVGDTCIGLFGFPRLDLGDGEHYVIDDFDLLCRVGRNTVEPWFGRMVVDPVSVQKTVSDILVIPGAEKAPVRAGNVHSGTVEILSPWLKETSETVKEGPRQAKGFEIVEHMPFAVGDRVAYRNRAVWEAHALGRKFLFVEMAHVIGRLVDDAIAVG